MAEEIVKTVEGLLQIEEIRSFGIGCIIVFLVVLFIVLVTIITAFVTVFRANQDIKKRFKNRRRF